MSFKSASTPDLRITANGFSLPSNMNGVFRTSSSRLQDPLDSPPHRSFVLSLSLQFFRSSSPPAPSPGAGCSLFGTSARFVAHPTRCRGCRDRNGCLLSTIVTVLFSCTYRTSSPRLTLSSPSSASVSLVLLSCGVWSIMLTTNLHRRQQFERQNVASGRFRLFLLD